MSVSDKRMADNEARGSGAAATTELKDDRPQKGFFPKKSKPSCIVWFQTRRMADTEARGSGVAATTETKDDRPQRSLFQRSLSLKPRTLRRLQRS